MSISISNVGLLIALYNPSLPILDARPCQKVAGSRQMSFVTFPRDFHLMDNSAPQDLSLDKLRAGDRLEFARLVDLYSSSVYGLGLRMLGNEPDAEDVLQNTFLSAWTHLPDFEGRSSLATWLYRIAANEALMLLRRKRPEIQLEDAGAKESPGELVPSQLLDWSGLPEDELMSAQGKLLIGSAIQGLPEALRLVLVLRDVEGLSIKETAEALELSETNVKTRLLRARLRLREKLSAYYSERLVHEDEHD
jgi:RNA polymerase sigma-70 factor, ECF subfamily